MMKISEVSKRLLGEVELILKPRGFIKQKGSEDWRLFKSTTFGYNEVSILIWPHENFFYVGLAFSIRINELNEVYNPYSSFSETSYKTSSTIGAGINSFGYNDDGKIKVETLSELDNAIHILTEILIDKALPFFDHFTDVKSLDEEFNRENRKQHLFAHDTDRCLIGITAASLNGNSRFSYWEQYYRERLKNASLSRKEKYEALVAYLKKRN